MTEERNSAVLPIPPNSTAPHTAPDPPTTIFSFSFWSTICRVDLGVGRAEPVRNQFYQEVDALDEGRAAGDRAGGR